MKESHSSRLKKFYLSCKTSRMMKSSGQITQRSEVGRWIEMLASLSENQVIVEIGAWNGLGSSQLIMRGVKQKEQQSYVWGFEINLRMYNLAKKNLSRYRDYSLVYGSIITADDLVISNLTSQEEQWLAQDMNDLRSSPNVLSQVPEHIDLLILDGGEFSTYAEFSILESRCTGFIVLDDINVRKGSKIMSELNSSRWLTIFVSDERNGTAVLRRVG